MTAESAILADMLSLFSLGHERVSARAREYLERHGRLTITSVSVFERLRGYHAALRAGKPFERQLQAFELLVGTSIILSLDQAAADRAARIWAMLGGKGRRALGDILIAGIASASGRPLVTRNRRDFEPVARLDFTGLRLLDWSSRN